MTAAVAVGTLFVLSPNLPLNHVPSEDEGVFLYIARTIAAGGVPYRDVWDHKPPGVYLVTMLAGANVWGVFALQAVALAAAIWLSYRALARGGLGPYGAMFGTLAWVVAVPRLFLEDGLQTNFPEFYALPLQFGALGLFAEEEARHAPTWRTAALGALGAAAALLKPTVIGLWVAIAVVLVFTSARSGRWRDFRRRGLLIAGPFLGVLLLAVAWLAVAGALPDAVDQVLRYNAAYSVFAKPLDRAEAIALGLRLTLPSGLVLLALAGWVTAVSGPRPPIVLLAAVALPIELVFASTGRAYHYYFLPWLPAMGVLAGYLCWTFLTRFGQRFSFVVLLVSVSMAIVPALLVGRLIGVRDDGAVREAATYIDSATTGTDTVLVWGSRAEVLLLADRHSATRFVYQYAALATRGYASPARIDELVADLAREKPVLIIDASKDSFVTPPLDRAGFAAWTSPEPQYAWLPETLRIVEFVEADYEQVGVLRQSGWPVWRLRSR
ncbi:MAG: hypothetical protein AUH33_01170 [Chloroflexi bacterium 13_1_40CM_68_21]|nr:MAG: hypothetical protein AUH33_01170 [Chloroflexi bacterium 13_1_40CM_68_21]